MTRRTALLGLGAVVLVVAVIVVVAAVRNNGSEGVHTAASSSSASGASSVTTTTEPGGVAPHIWPFPSSSAKFGTPEEVVQSFAVDYLGMTSARLGKTEIRPGGATVEVFPNVRATTRTVVDVLQARGDWYVTGARADDIVVDTPQPDAALSSPLQVSGHSTAFEAQLGLELRALDSPDPVAKATAMGGANGEIGPFATTITPPATDKPLLLLVYEADASGQGSYTKVTAILLGA